MGFYPDIQELLQGEDYERLLVTRRSLFALARNIIWAGIFAVVIYYLVLYFEDPRFRWLAVIPVVLLLEVLRKYHDDLYMLGMHKVTHFNGRLSLSYSVPVVKYAHIRSVTVNQDIWGRIFDFGDVMIQTAAQDKNEVVLEGVRAPLELATLVEDLRNHSRKMQDEDSPLAEDDHQISDHDE